MQREMDWNTMPTVPDGRPTLADVRCCWPRTWQVEQEDLALMLPVEDIIAAAGVGGHEPPHGPEAGVGEDAMGPPVAEVHVPEAPSAASGSAGPAPTRHRLSTKTRPGMPSTMPE